MFAVVSTLKETNLAKNISLKIYLKLSYKNRNLKF